MWYNARTMLPAGSIVRALSPTHKNTYHIQYTHTSSDKQQDLTVNQLLEGIHLRSN